MTFNELKDKIKNYPLFKLEDVFKRFPRTQRQTTLNQLNFWSKKGYLENIIRGVYKLSDFEIKDPFLLANFIYGPAYISLETALNYYSIIPDIPFAITSVTINKTKKFNTKNYGVFYYNHLKPDLFFGFKSILIEKNYSYNIALPEKALFDYLYLKAKKIESLEGFIEELRLSLPKKFNWQDFKNWTKLVSKKNKTFHKLVEILIKKYA
ncbi:MAG: type IV toxin-antitoxin system AbiEi family antitoxin domain-containing protein [Minisyncoccia bacterium]